MDDIEKLQYRNLRKHLDNKLINPILGKDYYNEAIDVYKADEFTMRDLKREYDNLKMRYNSLCLLNIGLEIVIILLIVVGII